MAGGFSCKNLRISLNLVGICCLRMAAGRAHYVLAAIDPSVFRSTGRGEEAGLRKGRWMESIWLCCDEISHRMSSKKKEMHLEVFVRQLGLSHNLTVLGQHLASTNCFTATAIT